MILNRRVIGFIKKEFIHILRDRRTLIMIFGIPIIEILLFGYVIRTDISNINIGIIDYSNGIMSQHIVNKLKGNRYFHMFNILIITKRQICCLKRMNFKRLLFLIK